MKNFPDLPPVWLVAFLILNWAGARWLPWGLDFGLMSIVSWGCIAVGLALIGWSAGWFWYRKTTIEPHHTPKVLIVEGPFRLSRNPIYLGMAIILAGAIIGRGQPACLVLLIAFIWVISTRFIRGEEAALRRAFGRDAETYLQTTRRWL